MPITPTQRAQAEQRQWTAARDNAPQVRLVAGPGTGKSYTIEKRVAHLLTNGADPDNAYIISFTRATCAELRDRIQAIQRKAALAGFAMAYLVVGMATMGPFIILGPNAPITTNWLPLIFGAAGFTHFYAWSIAILAQYGWRNRDGGK